MGALARLRRRWRSVRVEVRDGSMCPTLEPGDRLLVDPIPANGPLPEPGDLVVVHDPESPRRWLVKRVAVDPNPGDSESVFVLGDAASESRDSRTFGAVPRRLLVGRPWFRYLPAARRGPLPGPTRRM